MIPKMTTRERWYWNPDLLQAAVEEYGTLAEAARQIGGVDESTLQKRWRAMNLPKLPPGPTPRTTENNDALKRLAEKVYGS